MRQPGKPRETFPRGPILGFFALLAVLATTEASAPGLLHSDGGVPEVDLDAGVEEPAAVDTRRERALTGKAGPPAPVKPAAWQQRAPCKEGEEAIHGACYVQTVRKPPCPPSFFEHAGACFVAVAKVPRPDTSVEE